MLIGILQTGHFPDDLQEEHGDYDVMFARLLDGHGLDFRTWNVVDMDFPDGPEDADGWLVTGSRHGAYEDHPFIPPLEDLIREIDAARRPLIGVCFGHQIIAQALGGKVEKFEGGWSVGRSLYDMPDGREFSLNAWHQDQVTELPEGARVLASSTFCENAILAYGSHIWTVQAHPEFSGEIIEELARVRGPGVVPEDLLARAQEQIVSPTDRREIGAQMAAFFTGAHARAQAEEEATA